MRALIRQGAMAEVFREDQWPSWMDPVTMSTWPYPYALCEDAGSDDPSDYRIEREDDGGTVRYRAVMA